MYGYTVVGMAENKVFDRASTLWHARTRFVHL